MCGMCGDLLRRSRFSAKAQELWAAHAAVQDVICQKHEEIGSAAKGPSSCSTLARNDHTQEEGYTTTVDVYQVLSALAR